MEKSKFKVLYSHIGRTGIEKRILCIVSVLSFLFCAIACQLCFVVFDGNILLSKIKEGKPIERADFVDRNGVLLAGTVSTFSVYANPSMIYEKKEATKHLIKLFPEISAGSIKQKISSSKNFVWISRHITPEQKMKITALGIVGIDVIRDFKRIYPHGNLFCHAIGITDIDQEGISGLEKAFNGDLHKSKKPVVLSFDARVQHILRDELLKTITAFNANGGNAILLDIATGEIIAMVSLPDFSPESPPKNKSESLFNRNVSGVYEFGSLMKIHNVAMILENKIATLNSVYDASSPLRIGRFKITDFKGKNRPLTVCESFLFSSNIANAKMAMDAGPQKQSEFLKRFEFNAPIKTEMSEKGRPLFPAMKMWNKSQIITISYGYGIAITPLHMIRSIAGIVSGRVYPITFLKKEGYVDGKRVVSDETATSMRDLLFLATRDGQATRAAVQGYCIGAKTGTANMRVDGKYKEKNNLTSCASVFPINNPRYALLVCIDRAKTNASIHFFATAGWIAAPLASSIVKQVAPFLGVMPNDETYTSSIHTISCD